MDRAMNQPVNGGLQHQPLIARFSAFHPFGGRFSSLRALIVSPHERSNPFADPRGVLCVCIYVVQVTKGELTRYLKEISS